LGRQDGGAPLIDPLGDFVAERPSPIEAAATTLAPRKSVVVRPASRPPAPRVSTPVPAPRASRAPTPKVLWSFGSGVVVGAALSLIVVSWFMASEPPPLEAVSAAPAPVSPAASEAPPVAGPPAAEPPVAVAVDRSEPPVVEKETPAPVPAPRRDVRPIVASLPPQATTKRPFIGSMQIHSTPSGARVVIDGKPAGVTPLVVADLTAGSHAVRVEAEGQIPWSSAIRVVADQQTNVNTTLSPSLENTSPLP
jgi:hypothetical protein